MDDTKTLLTNSTEQILQGNIVGAITGAIGSVVSNILSKESKSDKDRKEKVNAFIDKYRSEINNNINAIYTTDYWTWGKNRSSDTPNMSLSDVVYYHIKKVNDLYQIAQSDVSTSKTVGADAVDKAVEALKGVDYHLQNLVRRYNLEKQNGVSEIDKELNNSKNIINQQKDTRLYLIIGIIVLISAIIFIKLK